MSSLHKQYPINTKAYMAKSDRTLTSPPLSAFVLTDEDPIVSIHIPIQYRKFLDIKYDFVRNVVAMAYLQTFDRWELKLIDDSDGQLNLNDLLDQVELLLNFKIKRHKVSYIQTFSNNLGIKRNTLINMTHTHLIANWDDDDIYLKDYLKKAVKFFELNPLQIGIFAGRRSQYNIANRHCIKCHPTKYCNGAAYYIIRKELFDKYPYIRYNKTSVTGEEKDIIKDIRHNINRAWSNQETVCSGCDNNYVRMRYDGNLTHNDGEAWLHDIEDQNKYGGSFMEDGNLTWLLEQLPECFHDFYKQLSEKIKGVSK